jgi:uncharacterized protein YegL
MNRKNGKILTAVLVSVFLHGAFFTVSRHIVIPGMGGAGEEVRKIFRVKDVDQAPRSTVLFNEPEKITVLPEREESEPLFDSVMIEHAASIEQKDKALERKKEKTLMEKEKELPAFMKDENLMDTEEKRIQEITRPEFRGLTDVVLSKGPSSFSSAPRVKQQDASYSENLPAIGNVLESAISGEARKKILPGQGEKAFDENLERVGKYEDMTSYLDVKIKTFQNPITGEKFFSVHIGVKEGVRIKEMPKELVFLLDSSKSVTESRFEYVKKGLSDALKSFGEKDHFNIIAFKNERTEFAGTPVRATQDNIRNAKIFLDGLAADGRTDIENVLLGIVRQPSKRKPSYIVLISDGRPTSGMTNSGEIIRTITRENKGVRPIFSFGVGLRVNEYLLDFISYQNRAWSAFAKASDTAGRDLAKFYEGISSPIMTDLRYRISGIESEEMFPRELPDFYHARGLTVYGKYWDEDVFSMQLLGEVDGEIKEMIFKKRLSEAENGRDEIENSWAFHKIYHMVGQETMARQNSGALTGEIEFLSKKYGIEVPYLNGEEPEVFEEEE